MSNDLIYSNGIDAETGEPLLPAMPAEMVAELAKGNPIDLEDLKELKARRRMLSGEADYGVMAGVDPNDLAQAGWGVIFAFEDQARLPALREALDPLLKLRQQQAGERYRDEARDPKFFYRPGEFEEHLAGAQRRRARPGRPGQGALLPADRRRPGEDPLPLPVSA